MKKNKRIKIKKDKKISKTWRFVLGALVVLALITPLAFSYGTNKSISGKVASFYNNQREDNPIYIIVELDGGGTIQARAFDNFTFKKGHRVMINEKTTLFGGKTYTLLQYLD